MNKIDIDHLVQNILVDLMITPEVEKVHPIVVTEKPKQTNNNRNEFYLDNRVISLSDLKDKLDGATKLIISTKSILTPSAKDEIRRRKIEIAVRLPDSTTKNQNSFWLALHGNNVLSQNMIFRLQREFKIETETFEKQSELITRAEIKLIEMKQVGVALSRQAAKLLVKANRKTLIRAIPGFDPVQITEDVKEVDANLLVLQPGRISERKLFEIVKKYTNR